MRQDAGLVEPGRDHAHRAIARQVNRGIHAHNGAVHGDGGGSCPVPQDAAYSHHGFHNDCQQVIRNLRILLQVREQIVSAQLDGVVHQSAGIQVARHISESRLERIHLFDERAHRPRLGYIGSAKESGGVAIEVQRHGPGRLPSHEPDGNAQGGGNDKPARDVARADHRARLRVGLPDPEELVKRAPHQDVVCDARFHIEIEGFLEGHAKPAIPPVRTEDYIYGNHRLLTELQPQIIAPFTRRTANRLAGEVQIGNAGSEPGSAILQAFNRHSHLRRNHTARIGMNYRRRAHNQCATVTANVYDAGLFI